LVTNEKRLLTTGWFVNFCEFQHK